MSYVDAGYAGDIDFGRSMTGFVFMLACGPICWKSTLQDMVALSIIEAEYMIIT